MELAESDRILMTPGAAALATAAPPPASNRLNADPAKVEQGLARLVLTLVELLRQLLEREAVRHVEAGVLSPDQEEALGLALFRLAEKMQELCCVFDLKPEDLNLDLGPLGRLV